MFEAESSNSQTKRGAFEKSDAFIDQFRQNFKGNQESDEELFLDESVLSLLGFELSDCALLSASAAFL